MRVVIYCRVSTEHQELDRQVNELTLFAERMGYELLGTYKEVVSGSENKRVERDKVLKLIKKKELDAVLITELSRWGRSTKDLVETVELMKSRNVSLITTSGHEFNITTPTGNLLFQLMAVLAEFERKLIGERVKSGMAEKKRKGGAISRPVGGRNKRINKNIKDICQLYKDGVPILRISERLNISRPTIINVLKKEGIYRNR